VYRIFSISAITDKRRVMKKINATVVTLWIFGYSLFTLSLSLLIFSFFRDSTCSGSISCQVETLMYQSISIFGMFIGAVMVVFGFWKRTKDNLKDSDSIEL
jgi:CHASE2 domain-containing sensor protein